MSELEQEIQAKGLTAPRVTPTGIDSVIASVHYFTAAEGALGAYKANGDIHQGDMPTALSADRLPCVTICTLVLTNGYVVIGHSACGSRENFDVGIGRRRAREIAVAQIWPLLGYELRTKLTEEVNREVV